VIFNQSLNYLAITINFLKISDRDDPYALMGRRGELFVPLIGLLQLSFK
jgi:hypothetical protein